MAGFRGSGRCFGRGREEKEREKCEEHNVSSRPSGARANGFHDPLAVAPKLDGHRTQTRQTQMLTPMAHPF